MYWYVPTIEPLLEAVEVAGVHLDIPEKRVPGAVGNGQNRRRIGPGILGEQPDRAAKGVLADVRGGAGTAVNHFAAQHLLLNSWSCDGSRH